MAPRLRLAYTFGRQLALGHRYRATTLALFLGSADGLPRTALARATWQRLKGGS